MLFRRGRRSRPGAAGPREARAPDGGSAVTRSQVDASNAAAPAPHERACCCSAPPRVRVLLPAPDGRCGPGGQVDILLCDHHYRASAARLVEIGMVAAGNDRLRVRDPTEVARPSSQRQGA